MRKHLSSTLSAKDKRILSNLDDLNLTMRLESPFMTDTEREALQAEARHARRRQILQPRKPIHPTKFGMFIAGLIAGALLAGLIAFVTSVIGPGAGGAVAIGTAITLAVIGVQLGAAG
jgi:hypothetical protein